MWAWTDERVERLKEMRGDGCGYPQISRELGCSRHAAIGKAFRIGLSEPRAPSKPRQYVERPIEIIRLQPMPKLRTVRTSSEPIPLVDLTSDTCRWPVSGEFSETLFCGAATDFHTYCGAHRRLAYQARRENV